MSDRTHIHPANSPVNLLSAAELEEYIRQWHLGNRTIIYRKHGMIGPVPLSWPPRYVKRIAPFEKGKK